MQPIQKKDTVTLASTALIGTSNEDGTLATITYEVLDESPAPLKITALKLTELILSDAKGKRIRPIVNNAQRNVEEK